MCAADGDVLGLNKYDKYWRRLIYK